MTEAAESSLTFGVLLRRYRERAGLSREELAEQAGMSWQAIGALERGERRHPHGATVRRLADALGLSQEERSALLVVVPRRGQIVEPAAEKMTAAPPPVTAEGAPTLPTPLTPLLGREGDVARVRALLGEGMRLLTLTGPGGVGKTRLALQIAREMREQFADGVGFVSLAPLTDAGLVLSTIAQVLEVRESGGRPLGELLQRAVGEQHLLLVLDNCEHVLSGVAKVAPLLEACGQLVVLATSRAPLRVLGEQEYPVDPLPLPAFGGAVSREEVLCSPAVRLFVDRAQAASAEFTLSEENAPAVAAICERLDGLPLALELAAPRVKLLAPQVLLSRLHHALPLLTGGGRDVPARQQTLRSTIAWSYELLEEGERALLRRLAVFAGGCSLEAAERVCAGMDGEEVLEGLGSLVDKSLLQVREVGGELRFVLLETIREYALEELKASGEEEGIRETHARSFLALAEEIEPVLRGPTPTAPLRRLEADHDNLRAALQWALDGGEAELGLRLAGALSRFWELRGHLREGRRWLEQMLTVDAANGPGSPALRARALSRAGNLAFVLNDARGATHLFEQSLSLQRELGDRRGMAEALACLGELTTWQGKPHAALAWREEGLALAREEGDTGQIARALLDLAQVVMWQGDRARLRELTEEALELYREVGDKAGMAGALELVGHLAQNDGDSERAQALFEDCARLVHQAATDADIRPRLESLALIARSRGWYERSIDLSEDSLARSLALGDRREAARTRCGVARSAHERGEYERAAALCLESLIVFREVDDLGGIAYALLDLSRVAVDLHDAERAVDLSEEALALFRDLGHTGQIAHSLHVLGLAVWLKGDERKAEALLEESLTLFRDYGHRMPLAQVLVSMGVVALDRGDDRRAEKAFAESLALAGVGASRWLLARELEGMAGVAVTRGQLERAVRLFGAADGLRTAIGAPLAPAFRPAYERHVAVVRTVLGEARCALLWEDGRVMTLAQALAFALDTAPGDSG